LGQFPAYNVRATQKKLAEALDAIVIYVQNNPDLFKKGVLHP
jgi:hypothetical protein